MPIQVFDFPGDQRAREQGYRRDGLSVDERCVPAVAPTFEF